MRVSEYRRVRRRLLQRAARWRRQMIAVIEYGDDECGIGEAFELAHTQMALIQLRRQFLSGGAR